MFSLYLERNLYNVNKDFEQQRLNHLLHKYKKTVLEQNGYAGVAKDLFNTSVQFQKVAVDAEGLEDAVDVSDIYPMSLEDERKEILNRTQNLDYLRQAYNISEYCRGRCKVAPQQLRNIVLHPRENQMCFTDCLNVRFEK